jgi:hypothetical protein
MSDMMYLHQEEGTHRERRIEETGAKNGAKEVYVPPAGSFDQFTTRYTGGIDNLLSQYQSGSLSPANIALLEQHRPVIDASIRLCTQLIADPDSPQAGSFDTVFQHADTLTTMRLDDLRKFQDIGVVGPEVVTDEENNEKALTLFYRLQHSVPNDQPLSSDVLLATLRNL